MTLQRLYPMVAAVILCQTAFIAGTAAACTGIAIKPTDGSVIGARTLEFAQDLQSEIIVVPRQKEFVGTAPGDKPGLKWKTKYGSVGANAFKLPIILDGLNEKGLYVGIFYMPGYAQYQKVSPADQGKALAPWELPTYLLGTCTSVKEAVAATQTLLVGEVVQKDFGSVPGVHYVIRDAQGQCVVLEYINGELKVHENPFGVITNAPTFDWHVTNLRNYVNMTVNNVPPVDIKGIKLAGFGQGTGMLGLPGDFTPPSRFVRAVAFSMSAMPVKTAREGVLQAFHILNQFDIPKGAARGTEDGKRVADYTQWTSAADLSNARYYFNTYDSRRIRMIDLKKAELDAKDIKTISMAGDEVIDDLTNTAK